MSCCSTTPRPPISHTDNEGQATIEEITEAARAANCLTLLMHYRTALKHRLVKMAQGYQAVSGNDWRLRAHQA
jgi:hypothetical protein